MKFSFLDAANITATVIITNTISNSVKKRKFNFLSFASAKENVIYKINNLYNLRLTKNEINNLISKLNKNNTITTKICYDIININIK